MVLIEEEEEELHAPGDDEDQANEFDLFTYGHGNVAELQEGEVPGEAEEGEGEQLEDLEPFQGSQGSPLNDLDCSSESPTSPTLPGGGVQFDLADDASAQPGPDVQHPESREASHSEELRQALDYLAAAHRSLCYLSSDVSIENLERLYAVRRSLQDDLEIATSWTVDDRLQALLKLHSQALEDGKRAEEKCEALKPEVMMLKRSIGEITRRMPKKKILSAESPDQELQLRSARLQAVEKAMEKRSEHAEKAKESLLSEDQLLSANLNNAKNVLKEAVLEGQRLEDMRDEAATEVFRACRALAQLSHLELLGKQQPKRYQKVKELESFLAKSAAAPWRLTALHQPPQTGSLGTTSATAALLDPDAYRLNRESATAQADKDLEAAMELLCVTRDELKRTYHDEVQRQKEEEQTFAAELQSLKERLQQRRHGVDSAMASHIAEKEHRLQEAHRQLTLELRQIETQERSNQEALRQEVIKAKKRLEQASATAKQQLDLHLARVKADCRELLRGTAIQWEKAVLHERKALKEAKLRRDKWQKRVDTSRNAFRGHCAKTGIYARTMDSSRRAILDSLVPRAIVGDLNDHNS